jgi:hypothetical protein
VLTALPGISTIRIKATAFTDFRAISPVKQRKGKTPVKRRIIIILGALCIGLGVTSTAPALAQSNPPLVTAPVGAQTGIPVNPLHANPLSNNGVEVCAYYVSMGLRYPTSPCANNYNGGALIKSYAPGVNNEDIVAQSLGNGDWQFYDYQTGYCLGDNNNSSTDAKVGSEDSCPSTGDAGWGTVFAIYSNGCAADGGQFYNFHWKAYMSGAGSNGSQWYLNTPSAGGYCYVSFT